MADPRDRLAALRDAVESIRSRGAGGGRDVSRYLFYAGTALFPLGILFVIFGWYGAAHTPYAFEQTPYLISGGLLGVGFVLVGGFLYFGYWLTRLGADARTRDDRATQVLERIEHLLASQDGHAPEAASNGQLVATPKGTLLHRADCVVVQGKTKLRKVSGGTKGYEPCKLCNPDVGALT